MTEGYLIYGIGYDSKILENAVHSINKADPDRPVHVIDNLPFGPSIPGENPLLDVWQVYHETPFEQSILITQPMWAAGSLEYLWDTNGDFVMGQPYDFRGDIIYPDFSIQKSNNIPSFSFDVVYFCKSKIASEFFKMADPIFKNWRHACSVIIPKSRPTTFDLTIMSNVVGACLGKKYPSNIPYIICDVRLPTWIHDEYIQINNFKQSGLFIQE